MREWTRRPWVVPAGCGALAVVLVFLAAVPSLRPAGWSVTALPRVDANTGMGAAAKARDPGFHTVRNDAYDGQFYWGIAVDPIASGDVHQAFDKATYRYGHPLLGWLGWLFSAGQARAAPAALFGLGIVTMLAAAVAASALGTGRGRSGAEGLFIALNPGLLYSAAHDLTEPLSIALLLVGVAAYVRGRRIPALVCFAFLPLTKEPLVVVPLVIAAWELVRSRRLKAGLPFAAAVVPSVIWWTYARIHLGAWFTTGDTALGAPFSGWRRALLDAGVNSYSSDGTRAVNAEAAIVVLVALLALLAVGAFAAVRLRGPLDPAFLVLAGLAACLAPNATVLLRDALRNTSIQVALVPFVLGPPLLRRAAPSHRRSDGVP
jgi:hypothetical protein